MFEFLIQTLQKLGDSFDEEKYTLLLGNNSLDYNTLLPFFLQHYIEKREQAVLILNFTDLLGPLISISRNLSLKLEKAAEEGLLFYQDLSSLGAEDYLWQETPFLNKPSSLFFKQNGLELDDQNPLGNLNDSLLQFVEEKQIKHMIVLGFESYLVCQQQVDALKSVIKLNSILDKLIGRNISILNCVNRDCSNDLVQRSYMLKQTEKAQRRLYLVENEGGFSNQITGHLILDVENIQHRETHKKRIKFHVEDKTVKFFEKVTLE